MNLVVLFFVLWPLAWVIAFRVVRGSFALRSNGQIDAINRNIAITAGNVAIITLNVVVVVVVTVLDL